MKVFISADIEGCTGIVGFSQCGRPDGQHYDYAFARQMMTHDVNAAIRGARAAGATEIVVKDGHATCKNLLIRDLEPGVELISGVGSGNDGMMDGIDGSYDAAMLIGYHPMAGALHGMMEHALVGGLHRFWINGNLAGEIATNAAVAGAYGVPLVFVATDAAGAEETAAVLPQASFYSTKTGLGKFMGRLKHPSETGPGIEKFAAEGCSRRSQIQPYTIEGPVTMRAEFHKVEEADLAATLVGVTRIDGYTIEFTGADLLQAHSLAYNAFALSIRGRSSDS
jgi:D-amino peptidase